jgi:hypothetical protein
MMKKTLEERAYEVLFNNGDESLLSEGEVYEIYDTVMELVAERKQGLEYSIESAGFKSIEDKPVTWH